MAEVVKFSLVGVDELLATIKTVNQNVRYKSGRFALRKAANLVADTLRNSATRLDDPKTAEMIAKNVAVRFSSRRYKSTGDLMMRVGILGGARSSRPDARRGQVRRRGQNTLSELGEISGKGKGNPGGDTFYWRFLEFGTQHAAARPFMRPALKKNIDAATAMFVLHFKRRLNTAIAKARKGGK